MLTTNVDSPMLFWALYWFQQILSNFITLIKLITLPYTYNNMKKHNNSNAEWISHALNTSKTKLAYSFQKSQRFTPQQSFSPNKYYDLPTAFCNRSQSPQRSMRSSLQRDTTFSPWAHNLSNSLDIKRGFRERSNTSFGIGRDQYYKGRSQKSELGPGAYNVRSSMQKKFYMGRKVNEVSEKKKPDCTSYNVTAESYNKLSTSKNSGVYKMKVEYYPKGLLKPYDNKIPGPGSYKQKGIADAIKNKSYKQTFQRKKTNSSFGIGERMKTQSSYTPAPDYYNRFSQFGRPKY